MTYKIARKARETTFDVDTGFIIAIGFAKDPVSKYNNFIIRRYTFVIPFVMINISIKKYK